MCTAAIDLLSIYAVNKQIWFEFVLERGTETTTQVAGFGSGNGQTTLTVALVYHMCYHARAWNQPNVCVSFRVCWKANNNEGQPGSLLSKFKPLPAPRPPPLE